MTEHDLSFEINAILNRVYGEGGPSAVGAGRGYVVIISTGPIGKVVRAYTVVSCSHEPLIECINSIHEDVYRLNRRGLLP